MFLDNWQLAVIALLPIALVWWRANSASN